MQVPYGEGLASHTGPESWTVVREDSGDASLSLRSQAGSVADELSPGCFPNAACRCTVTECCTTCCEKPSCPTPSPCAIIDPADFSLRRERFVAYQYAVDGGKMSKRYDWNIRQQALTMTQFHSYDKGRLEEVWITRRQFSGATPRREVLSEKYAYNVFGDRVAILQCDTIGVDRCKGFARLYDYVDGQVLVERTSNLGPEHPIEPPLQSRLISVLTWGPLGLISRRGVAFGGPDPDPDAMCNYTYLSDAMGNVMALMDAAGDVRLQHFDAFGNNIGGFVMMACAAGGRPGAGPEVMQTGQFNWRGAEGSMTDLVVHFWGFHEFNADGHLVRVDEQEALSTGLIYMVNRYYEPETGRFTQADLVRFGPEILSGQNNRWVYCANNPVNWTDPDGLRFPFLHTILGVLALLMSIIMPPLALLFRIIAIKCFRWGGLNPNLPPKNVPPRPPIVRPIDPPDALDALLFDFLTGATEWI